MRRTGILLLSLALLLAPGAMASGMASATGEELVNTEARGIYPSVSGSIIAFHTREFGSGQDVNGDGDIGDTYDVVIRYYDVATHTLINTLVEGANPSISGNIIAFSTWERWVEEDLNGDGDIVDFFIRYYDIETDTVINTGAEGFNPSISGNIIAFSTYEHLSGMDLNGDGDTDDPVVRYYDIATGTVTNIGAVGREPAVSGNIVALATYEYLAGEDLNRDRDTMDYVIRYYDVAKNHLTNTGVLGRWPSVSGSIIAFRVDEWSFGQDLNGDGDDEDYVISYYDISRHTLMDTGVAGHKPSVGGNIIAFASQEQSIGMGQDLNGDGDTVDSVLRYYNISTGALTTTGVIGGSPSVAGDILAFSSYEPSLGQGGQDLNGDGDTDDSVIRYFNLPQTPTLPTIEAISEQIDAFLADGSIDNEGIAESLQAFVEQAQAMMETGNTVAAENILNAFINSVEAQSQSGRLITTDAAQVLIDGAQSVIDGL